MFESHRNVIKRKDLDEVYLFPIVWCLILVSLCPDQSCFLMVTVSLGTLVGLNAWYPISFNFFLNVESFTFDAIILAFISQLLEWLWVILFNQTCKQFCLVWERKQTFLHNFLFDWVHSFASNQVFISLLQLKFWEHTFLTISCWI